MPMSAFTVAAAALDHRERDEKRGINDLARDREIFEGTLRLCTPPSWSPAPVSRPSSRARCDAQLPYLATVGSSCHSHAINVAFTATAVTMSFASP